MSKPTSLDLDRTLNFVNEAIECSEIPNEEQDFFRARAMVALLERDSSRDWLLEPAYAQYAADYVNWFLSTVESPQYDDDQSGVHWGKVEDKSQRVGAYLRRLIKNHLDSLQDKILAALIAQVDLHTRHKHFSKKVMVISFAEEVKAYFGKLPTDYAEELSRYFSSMLALEGKDEIFSYATEIDRIDALGLGVDVSRARSRRQVYEVLRGTLSVESILDKGSDPVEVLELFFSRGHEVGDETEVFYNIFTYEPWVSAFKQSELIRCGIFQFVLDLAFNENSTNFSGYAEELIELYGLEKLDLIKQLYSKHIQAKNIQVAQEFADAYSNVLTPFINELERYVGSLREEKKQLILSDPNVASEISEVLADISFYEELLSRDGQILLPPFTEESNAVCIRKFEIRFKWKTFVRAYTGMDAAVFATSSGESPSERVLNKFIKELRKLGHNPKNEDFEIKEVSGGMTLLREETSEE